MTENKPRRKAVIKTMIIIMAVILSLLCLFPFPARIKDGGSLYLQPMIPVYSVTRWNGLGRDENSRTAGTTVKIFGMEVYNSFHEEAR